MIYLDNAATTKIHPEVLDTMMPYLTDQFGNPGSAHKLGREAAAAVANAREQVAELLNCEPGQIVFTSGATEANNMVFQGLREHLRTIGKTHIISSTTEHKSVLNALEALKMKDGFGVSLLGINSDICVSPNDLASAITNKTGLASIMYVNNEVGFVNQVNELADVCHESGVLFHTDCVQAAGYFDLDVDGIGCDFMTISSHKISGPKGVGALYIRDPTLLSPMIYGGSSQEFGLRGGTENVASIAGFGKACEIAKKERSNNVKIMKSIYRDFLLTFNERMHELGEEYRLSNYGREHAYKILSIVIPESDAGTLQMLLDLEGVCVSTGSACNSKENTPSHVLTALGTSDEDAKSTLRISFSPSNSFRDIQVGATTLANTIHLYKSNFKT